MITWERYSLFAPNWLPGNQSEGIEDVEKLGKKFYGVAFSKFQRLDIDVEGLERKNASNIYFALRFEEDNLESLNLERLKADLKLPKEALECEKAEIESELEKRLRQYKYSNSTETWSSRWVASPLAYLFPKERREEWLGDLYEVNREMLHKGYPHWMVNIINIGRTAILLVSGLSIKLSDSVSLGLRRGK